jgi:hypothetical protein
MSADTATRPVDDVVAREVASFETHANNAMSNLAKSADSMSPPDAAKNGVTFADSVLPAEADQPSSSTDAALPISAKHAALDAEPDALYGSTFSALASNASTICFATLAVTFVNSFRCQSVTLSLALLPLPLPSPLPLPLLLLLLLPLPLPLQLPRYC